MDRLLYQAANVLNTKKEKNKNRYIELRHINDEIRHT